MKKRVLGLLLALCLIVGLLPMVALADAAASVDFALFLDTTTYNQKTTVTLDKGQVLYFENITKPEYYNGKDLKCLTVGDADNWNLKLDYTGKTPVMTMKGLDINSGYVAIDFGAKDAVLACDLKVVIEGENTIVTEETTGNNYYNAPALALYTTGTVTIESKDNGKLSMKSNNNYVTDGQGATLYAGGDLVLDGANIAIEGHAAWGDPKFGIFAEGDVTVAGGELTIRQTKDLCQSIKCANFEAKDGASVKIWALAADSVGKDYPCIEANTIKIDAANVDIGAYDTAFSVAPVVTNCAFAKGSTQIPKWDGAPGEMTFKEDTGAEREYTEWKQYQTKVTVEITPTEPAATEPAATEPAGTTATQPAGTTATQPAGTTATQPAATEPAGTTATQPVGDGVDFYLYLDTTANNQKTTVRLVKGSVLYFKNIAKKGVNGSGKEVDLKCLTTGNKSNWNLKLDYTGKTPTMTLKGLDINSGIVGIDFGSKAAPLTSDLVIVIEADSTIKIEETTGNNYYNTPALSLCTTGTVTVQSKGDAKLFLAANNDYEGYNKNTEVYTSGRGTLYVGGNLVLNKANIAMEGHAAWGDSKFGIFAEGNVTVNGGELTVRQTKDLRQSINCANFVAKNGASVKIWAKNSDSVGQDFFCIEADTIKINAANVDIGAFDTAFSVEPEVTNVSFYKGSTQIPKWDGEPGELTFKEDTGGNLDYTTWKQVKISAGDVVVEPEATEPEATEPDATEPDATEPAGTTATQPAGTTATQPAGTTATQPAGTTATTPGATEPEATEPVGEGVDFYLFLDTTKNNQKETVRLAKGSTLYFKNVAKKGITGTSNEVDLKCLAVGTADDWNLKLDYTGEVPVMTLKGLDINSGMVGIDFGTKEAPIASDLVIVIEADSSIVIAETTGNNYYNSPALSLCTTGTVTVQSKDGAKLFLAANNDYEGKVKNEEIYKSGRGTLYVGGNLVLDKANIAMEGHAAWGDSKFGIFAEGNVTINGGELTVRQTKDLHQAIKCANFEIKNNAVLKIWALNSDSVGKDYPCIEAETIKINAANVNIGAFDTAFSVEPVITNCTFAKGSTQIPKWDGAPGELTFKEDSGDMPEFSAWKQFQSKAGEFAEEPEATEPGASEPADTTGTNGTTGSQPTVPGVTKPSVPGVTKPTVPGVTKPGETTPATEPGETTPATKPGTNGNDQNGDTTLAGMWIAMMAVISLGAAAVVTTKKYAK